VEDINTFSTFEHQKAQQKSVIFDEKLEVKNLKIDNRLTIEGILFNDRNESFSLLSSKLIETNKKQLPIE
jgi:hypothetical protein